MKKARLIWPPYPYKAGFCLTDDTDAADFDSIKIVYDFLKSINLRTTKTVWPYKPSEPCGIPATPASTLRGVTLEDKKYMKYCLELHKAGFEICLHGASAGNNKRADTIRAFDLMNKYFDGTDTFICHAKNADNIYWEEKVAPNNLFKKLISMYSKHRCFGEIEGSVYFWGDICAEKVKQIRLFRTRNQNTLSVNPSMPYFDEKKPFVKGWFSATKRRFIDCTTGEALKRLKKTSGLTVLYQYLHRYVDKKNKQVNAKFKEAALNLVADREIWVDTTAKILDRLRLIQGIFLVYRNNNFWIVNTNDKAVHELQIILPGNDYICCNAGNHVVQTGAILHVKEMKKNSIVQVDMNKSVIFYGKRMKKLDGHKRISIDFSFGTLYVNLAHEVWHPDSNIQVQPKTHLLVFNHGLSSIKPMSKNSVIENLCLFCGQMLIILREIIIKGRKLDVDQFLGAKTIKLEDHDNW